MVDRPADVVQFSADGTEVERLASFPQVPDPITMTVLPDGRAVLPVRAASQVRLMAVQKGKEPAPLINSADETAGPLTTCGPREVAFMIGHEPHETIAIGEAESGRIVRTIAPDKGPVDSLACSPDGLTLFFVARGIVWSVPSAASGAGARKIRSGDGVVADPSGRRLIVKVQEISRLRWFIVPLDGSAEHEIPPDSSISPAAIALSPNALSADGRLLTSLLPRDAWFNPPGVTDTVTGRITRIPSDRLSDYHSIGWTADGRVIAVENRNTRDAVEVSAGAEVRIARGARAPARREDHGQATASRRCFAKNRCTRRSSPAKRPLPVKKMTASAQSSTRFLLTMR